MLNGMLQPTHLIIILAVALLVLGPKRLPSAGRALGQGLREFKDSLTSSPAGALTELPDTAPTAADAHPDVVSRHLTDHGATDGAIR